MGLCMTETVVVEAVFHGCVSAAEINGWLERIERLVECRQPFYFLSTTQEQTKLVEEYRTIQAVWYKRHKQAFRACCRGLVRIVHSQQEQRRLDTPALHAAWGVPYFVTTERAAGLRWIAQRLEVAGDGTL